MDSARQKTPREVLTAEFRRLFIPSYWGGLPPDLEKNACLSLGKGIYTHPNSAKSTPGGFFDVLRKNTQSKTVYLAPMGGKWQETGVRHASVVCH